MAVWVLLEKAVIVQAAAEAAEAAEQELVLVVTAEQVVIAVTVLKRVMDIAAVQEVLVSLGVLSTFIVLFPIALHLVVMQTPSFESVIM